MVRLARHMAMAPSTDATMRIASPGAWPGAAPCSRSASASNFFGVSVAGLGAIANFLWVPYYPLWALTLVAVNIFVVWALCTGMRREADDDREI